jgi:hypothetical protein
MNPIGKSQQLCKMAMEEPRLIDLIRASPKPHNKLDFREYIRSDEITIDDIRNNLDLPWDYGWISIKKNITINDLLKPIPKQSNGKPYWKWCFVSLSFIIPVDDILAHREFPWNFKDVSLNKTLTLQHVLKNKDEKWDWQAICLYAKMSIREILDNRYEPYCFSNLSFNQSFHIDDILSQKELKFNMKVVSKNKTITIQHILNNLDVDWDWNILSISLPADDILRYSKLPWNWSYVASNPSLHIRHIIENIDIYIPFLSSTNAFEGKITPDTIDMYIEAYRLYAELHTNQQDVMQRKHHEHMYERISLYFKGDIDFILSHPEYNWDMLQLFKNRNFTPSQLIDLKNSPRNSHIKNASAFDLKNNVGVSKTLSLHPLLSLDDILKHPEIEWDFSHICRMHNKITARDKLTHPEFSWEN